MICQKSICWYLFAAIGLALAAVCVGGCGKRSGWGEMTGKVTFQGKPLPAGRIVFVCQDADKTVISAEIRDGVYYVSKIPAGRATVGITSSEPSGDATPGIPSPPPDPKAPPPPARSALAIPERYGSPETSGLAYDVAKGKQSKDFDLMP